MVMKILQKGDRVIINSYKNQMGTVVFRRPQWSSNYSYAYKYLVQWDSNDKCQNQNEWLDRKKLTLLDEPELEPDCYNHLGGNIKSMAVVGTDSETLNESASPIARSDEEYRDDDKSLINNIYQNVCFFYFKLLAMFGQSLLVAVKFFGVYIFWIFLHHLAHHLYTAWCVPAGITGLLQSVFLISTPQCQALRWVINHGADSVTTMWMLFGTWICTKAVKAGFVKSSSALM